MNVKVEPSTTKKKAEEVGDDDDDNDEDVILRCELCSKNFKSESQLLNHEKSKAHRKKVILFHFFLSFLFFFLIFYKLGIGN